MNHIYEIANYLNNLSDLTDEIRKLDYDKYKQYTDMQILENILQEKIDYLIKK